MRGLGRRVFVASAFFLLLFLLVVPVATFATDGGVLPAAPAIAPATAIPTPGISGASSVEAVPADETPDEPAADAAGQGGGSVGGVHISSQANPDTQAAVQSVLDSRKAQFNTATTSLQRTIDRLSAIDRRLDAARINTSAPRAQLAEARTALTRAKAAERLTVARYRSVLTSDDEAAAYAAARAAGRVSSLQLERARVKLLTAAKTLRAIVKNVTV